MAKKKPKGSDLLPLVAGVGLVLGFVYWRSMQEGEGQAAPQAGYGIPGMGLISSGHEETPGIHDPTYGGAISTPPPATAPLESNVTGDETASSGDPYTGEPYYLEPEILLPEPDLVPRTLLPEAFNPGSRDVEGRTPTEPAPYIEFRGDRGGDIISPRPPIIEFRGDRGGNIVGSRPPIVEMPRGDRGGNIVTPSGGESPRGPIVDPPRGEDPRKPKKKPAAYGGR